MAPTTINAATSSGPLLQQSAYASTIVVENNSTGLIWVTADGSAAVAGAGSAATPIAPGATVALTNGNTRFTGIKPPHPWGWTAQQNSVAYAGGFGTNVNVIAATASGTITAYAQ